MSDSQTPSRLGARLAAMLGIDRLAKHAARQEETLVRLAKTVDRLNARLDDIETAVREQRPLVDDIPNVRRELAKVQRQADDIRSQIGRRGIGGQLRRIGLDARALLRRELMDPVGLPYPYRLFAKRANLVGQNEGDGLTLAILEEAGYATHRFLDIGSGARGGAAAMFPREFGWQGVMIDGNEEHVQVARERLGRGVSVVHAFVTRENVNDLVRDAGLSGEIDFFSLDIDGVDYWIWEALTVVQPRLVVVEYNPLFGLDRAVTVPYDPAFNRHGFPIVLSKRFFGASLKAFCRLAARKGYRLVATDSAAINAFFLRNDLAPQVPELHVDDLPYRVSDIGKHEDVIAIAAREGLAVVDVD
jgi:hypothetical protein